ncbi:DUF5640 domain-containing protein [Eubacterium sp.]
MATNKKSGAGKVIFVIIFSILTMTLIPSGIYCAVERINPIQMVSSTFSTNNSELLVGKWQNQSRSSAYEFFDDGTYESYFSTFSFKGDYSLKGDELTLSNPSSDSTVVYKISVDKKTLTMTIVQENGMLSDNNQTTEYGKVDRIETKSLTDLLGTIVESAQEENSDSE